MILESLAVGPFQANCYILGEENSRKCLVIDPGAEFDRIWSKISYLGLEVEKIVLAHAHGDHIGAVRELVEKTGVKVWLHKEDYPLLADPKKNLSGNFGFPISVNDAAHFVEEGQEVSCGEIKLKVIHTPGHTPGGICLFGDDILFSGDSLFYGSIGRTDFHYSSLETLLDSLGSKILSLSDHTKVYPGHGPATTIGRERHNNPFLQSSFLYQYKH